MINIKAFTFNPFQENTYIVSDETKECIIIDPGCYEKSEKDLLKNYINQHDYTPVKLINTHCHIDHVLGNNFVSETWCLDLEIHELDLPLLNAVKDYAKEYGFNNYEESPQPTCFLKENDKISFGNSNLSVLFTPGHAPGHISLYSEEKILISGDVIFQMSIGRTDLPGGSYEVLIASIKDKLMDLPDETKIFCGHGPPTSIGFERKNNPFLK